MCLGAITWNLTERTFFWKKLFRVLRKFSFRNIQEKILRKENVVAPNLGNVSGSNIAT